MLPGSEQAERLEVVGEGGVGGGMLAQGEDQVAEAALALDAADALGGSLLDEGLLLGPGVAFQSLQRVLPGLADDGAAVPPGVAQHRQKERGEDGGDDLQGQHHLLKALVHVMTQLPKALVHVLAQLPKAPIRGNLHLLEALVHVCVQLPKALLHLEGAFLHAHHALAVLLREARLLCPSERPATCQPQPQRHSKSKRLLHQCL